MKTAEPIIKESLAQYNWKFIFYNAFESFYEESQPKRKMELSEIDKLAETSLTTRHEQQTLGAFTNE